MKSGIAIIGAVVAAGLAYAFWTSQSQQDQVATSPQVQSSAMVEIILPKTLSTNAQIGKTGFEAKCAACHGLNAAGQNGVAPPLIHKIYEPGHHGDESFQRAAALGVRAHHWRFGDMAPIEGVTRGDVAMIIAYIREVQRANGIN